MRTKGFSLIVGKIVMTIVIASMIGGTYITPAFGKDGGDRRGYNTQGRYQQGRYEHGQYVYLHGRRVYQPRTYSRIFH